MSNWDLTRPFTLVEAKHYIARIDGVEYVGVHMDNRKSTVVSHIDNITSESSNFQVADVWRNILLATICQRAGTHPNQLACGGVGYNTFYSCFFLLMPGYSQFLTDLRELQ
jgi:hypothetical protein